MFSSTVNLRAPALLLLFAAVAGCKSEPPPRTVEEFVENPILLEAAVVRCAANRSETRYDAECVNAREAVKRIDAAKAEARRAELEAQSERKRQQLRRTQQAAAEARRLATEEQRRREEEAYLAQFGELPDVATNADDGGLAGNVPGAVLPEPPPEDPVATAPITSPYDDPASYDDQAPVEAAPGRNAPTVEVAPETPASEAPADLEAIREELRRRGEQDDPGN